MDGKVSFEDLDLHKEPTSEVETAPATTKGKKRPAKASKKKKSSGSEEDAAEIKQPDPESSESLLKKRAKSNKIKAWLIVSSIITLTVVLCAAGIIGALRQTPMGDIRAYVNQSNSETAFKDEGVIEFIQVAFPEYFNTAKIESGYEKATFSDYTITRVTDITDTLAMVNFTVSIKGDPLGEAPTDSAWSILLNYSDGVYSPADGFRNVPLPVIDLKLKETEFMSFDDLESESSERTESAKAFLSNFFENYYLNNVDVINTLYNNPDAPLVIDNTGTFVSIDALELYTEPNALGYNAKVTYSVKIEGNVVQTTRYLFIEVSKTPVVTRLL